MLFRSDVVMRLGDPYLTHRANRRAKGEPGSGLGLGLFIAKTLLERSGAKVTTVNATPPGKGARVTILWPRDEFEEGRAASVRFGSDGMTARLDETVDAWRFY